MSLYTFGNKIKGLGSSPAGKWILIGIGGVLVFSLAFSNFGNTLGGGRGARVAGTSANAGETIATVNGDAISRAGFEQAADQFRQQAAQYGQPVGLAQTAQLNALVLGQLITKQQELQAAQKQGITVSDAEINRRRAEIVAQAGLAQRLGLAANASVADIDAAFAKDGQPSVETRLPDDAVRDDLLQSKLQTLLANKVNVTEADARASFQQWHTRHILLDTKKRTDAQAQVQAQQVLDKAKQPGTDFAALAKQISDDPGTKLKGGDDGWIDQSTQYVPEFKDAAFKLAKAGDVTLVKSPQYGYFIIQLVGVRSNLPKDFDKNKAQYIAQVKAQKQQQAQQDFLQGLQNDPSNRVVVTDPQLKADRELADAARASDPAKAQTAYRTAIADYQSALKAGPDAQQAAEMNAALATAYQATQQPDNAVAALQSALKAGDDPQLLLTLGTLYEGQKQSDKALTEFGLASKAAYDNPSVHQQLQGEYARLGKPQLAAAEGKWLSDYQARQASQFAAPPTAAPVPAPKPASGTPATGKPSGTVRTPGAVQVVPSGPAAPASKPAQ